MVVINKKKKETPEEKEARKAKEAQEAAGIQDEYQSKGFELVSWVQANKGAVSGLIVFIVVLCACFSGYIYYSARKNEEAFAAYLDAVKVSDSDSMDENTEAMEKSLLGVIENFPSAEVATVAKINLASLYFQQNATKSAEEYYSSALKDMKESDPLYPLAFLGYARTLLQDDKVDDAKKAFEKIIASKDFPGRDIALWESINLSQDNEAQRKEFIQTLQEDYPDSFYTKKVKSL